MTDLPDQIHFQFFPQPPLGPLFSHAQGVQNCQQVDLVSQPTGLFGWPWAEPAPETWGADGSPLSASFQIPAERAPTFLALPLLLWNWNKKRSSYLGGTKMNSFGFDFCSWLAFLSVVFDKISVWSLTMNWFLFVCVFVFGPILDSWVHFFFSFQLVLTFKEEKPRDLSGVNVAIWVVFANRPRHCPPFGYTAQIKC